VERGSSDSIKDGNSAWRLSLSAQLIARSDSFVLSPDKSTPPFQHEDDHLRGIVFLDRLESPRDIVTEREYQKLLKE
jgi:hypothetical protein